jgi:hypothetical protein
LTGLKGLISSRVAETLGFRPFDRQTRFHDAGV